MHRPIRTNFIFNSLYQITSIIIPIITLPYLSRVLLADGLGKYSYAYSVAYYFYIFIRLGLNSYGNRTIAFVKDDREKLSITFWEIYAFQALMGLLLSMLYIVYCSLLSNNPSLAWIFLLVVVTGAIDLTWFFYGLEEFKITALRDTIVKIVTTVCIFLFVKKADDVWKYALIFSIGFFVNQLMMIPLIANRVHFVKPGLSGVITHIKPNLILFLPTVAVSFYKTMDKIMLGTMSNSTEVGLYHSCENIIKVPLALVTALGTVMLPRMSNMLSNNEKEDKINKVFNDSIVFSMFISTSICIGIMTVAGEFVPLFFGPGFEKCIDIFYIILPSCIFLAFANVIRTQYLLPRKRDVLFITSLFAGAVLNVTLNLLLIPSLASVGAALGTLGAEIIVCVVQAACVFKEANIGRNIINSLPFVIAGVVMFVVCRNFVPPIGNEILALLVKILISGALYLSVLGVLVVTKRVFVRKTKW